jgi:hypothetical protein
MQLMRNAQSYDKINVEPTHYESLKQFFFNQPMYGGNYTVLTSFNW